MRQSAQTSAQRNNARLEHAKKKLVFVARFSLAAVRIYAQHPQTLKDTHSANAMAAMMEDKQHPDAVEALHCLFWDSFPALICASKRLTCGIQGTNPESNAALFTIKDAGVPLVEYTKQFSEAEVPAVNRIVFLLEQGTSSSNCYATAFHLHGLYHRWREPICSVFEAAVALCESFVNIPFDRAIRFGDLVSFYDHKDELMHVAFLLSPHVGFQKAGIGESCPYQFILFDSRSATRFQACVPYKNVARVLLWRRRDEFRFACDDVCS